MAVKRAQIVRVVNMVVFFVCRVTCITSPIFIFSQTCVNILHLDYVQLSLASFSHTFLQFAASLNISFAVIVAGYLTILKKSSEKKMLRCSYQFGIQAYFFMYLIGVSHVMQSKQHVIFRPSVSGPLLSGCNFSNSHNISAHNSRAGGFLLP